MNNLQILIQEYIAENDFVSSNYSDKQIELLKKILDDFSRNYLNCEQVKIGKYSNQEFDAIYQVFDSPITVSYQAKKTVGLWVDGKYNFYKQEEDGSWSDIDNL